ncbi:DNA adenine methylase [Pararoseomonas sp. SCSIO 73927]|uniref:DNA adenine methylase n=1 Tax=Pararoseomonas sp. SCSIO 73927 TaxID=3114537 RepID=UPI0030CC4F08
MESRDSLDLTPVQPVQPPAAYLGGKRNLAGRIAEQLRQVPHRTYVEPFVGMGGVFLRRPFRSQVEVINDRSRDVSNLFRILQRHYVQLMDTLRWQITSRAEFERLQAAEADTLTDLERAARFLYLQRLSFGGKIEGRNFGVDPSTPGRFDVTKLGPVLDAVHERLAGMVIECLPYEEAIRRYDRESTLFYLDPPYHGCEGDYLPGLFGPRDFDHMAAILARVKGRFLVSLNDTPEVRRIFGRFSITAVDTTYSVAGGRRAGGAGEAKEVLISGP